MYVMYMRGHVNFRCFRLPTIQYLLEHKQNQIKTTKKSLDYKINAARHVYTTSIDREGSRTFYI